MIVAGLRAQDPILDSAWQSSAVVVDSGVGRITEADIKASKSSWPIVMFLGVVFGGPYLIWRLLSSLGKPQEVKNRSWARGIGEYFPARAKYPFKVSDCL